mmetsp:Transcript_3048/g.11725  ORF Transcript_3048/g.11725 Transcript_3048/m.11725 type:complete len:91 (+) Transcript_3048:1810-2082(+)
MRFNPPEAPTKYPVGVIRNENAEVCTVRSVSHSEKLAPEMDSFVDIRSPVSSTKWNQQPKKTNTQEVLPPLPQRNGTGSVKDCLMWFAFT